MSTFTRVILALLLIGVAAVATVLMREAGWISVSSAASDGPWGPIPDCLPAGDEIDITPNEALAVSRFLDEMLGHDT